jgi:hypothetical protein
MSSDEQSAEGSKHMNEIDIEQARDELKENYRQKTGEELPDHVVDNLDLLTGTSAFDHVDIQRQVEAGLKERDDDSVTNVELAAALSYIGISGLAGVYAARYFVGWPAQVAGGLFVALLAAAAIAAVLGGIGHVVE